MAQMYSHRTCSRKYNQWSRKSICHSGGMEGEHFTHIALPSVNKIVRHGKEYRGR